MRSRSCALGTLMALCTAPHGAETFEAIVASVRSAGREVLLEHEVYAVLAEAGFETPRHLFWQGRPLRPRSLS